MCLIRAERWKLVKCLLTIQLAHFEKIATRQSLLTGPGLSYAMLVGNPGITKDES